jgi:hypothetical protein
MLRFGISDADLQDRRLADLLTYKMKLNSTVSRLKKLEYNGPRVPALANRFHFKQDDLTQTKIAYLIKACLESEDFIDVLTRRA